MIDELCASACGLDDSAKVILSNDVSPHPWQYEERSIDSNEFGRAFEKTVDALVDDITRVGTSRHLTKKSHWANRHLELLSHKFSAHPKSIVAARRSISAVDARELVSLVTDVCSYCLGVALGRWDVRRALDPNDELLRDAFACVPICASGALVGGEGLPATVTPEHYPVRIGWDGVIVDDPEQLEDIVRRVRDVFELIWQECSESAENEACQILGVKELRDYFRKPGKGGFWDGHVTRYSKSRRKAPIYWLLQSSRRNYALWLYYHRLDKDLLFKALVNYVEPKIRLETSRLETLRRQRTAAGENGKDSKRLAKDGEQQEDFISELKDFEDKLRRAANLHLEPDLDDGIVLNIAPLHELVPWIKARNYWEELLDGKYEWSSIGKQLRQKGKVK